MAGSEILHLEINGKYIPSIPDPCALPAFNPPPAPERMPLDSDRTSLSETERIDIEIAL